MNGFWNVLKYVLVVLVVLIGAGLIALGCLILIPGVNLFGVGYVSYDQKILEKQIENSTVQSVDKIVIDSGRFDVNLDVVNTNQIINGANYLTCRLKRVLSGFVVGGEENKKVEIETNVTNDGATKILNIVVKQPEKAWLFPTTTELNLFVTKSLLDTKILEINTTSGTQNIGAKPIYDSSNNVTNSFVKVGTLNLNNAEGAVNLGCVDIAQPLVVTKQKGDITSYLDLAVQTTISVSSGFGNVSLKNIGSSTNPQDLIIKDVWNASINANTVFGSVVAQNLTGGNIKIKELLGESDITNDYADFHIEKIKAPVKYTANDGLFEVNLVTGKLTINQKAGNIRISELGTASNALTHSINNGNAALVVSKLHDSVEIVSDSGEVNLTGCPEDDQRLTVKVTAKNSPVRIFKMDGNVNYDGLAGNSPVFVEYVNFVGENIFKNKSGNIEVAMPYDKNPPMWISWETNKSANITLPNFESTSKLSYEVAGSTENGISINEANLTTAEKLAMKTESGAIKVYRKERV